MEYGEDTTENCPICEAPSKRVYGGYPGYQRGNPYDIYACQHCNTSYSSPLREEEVIYRHIYNKIENIPGYDRYSYYPRAVKNKSEPLEYLAQEEASYFAVNQLLKELNPASKRILDYGCGLGYLVHALRKKGFNATGIDISAKAIRKAIETFGDFFITVAEFEQRIAIENKLFDIIIATELIEHVSDPKSLLNRIKTNLSPTGKIILTTPDRDFHPNGFWVTESPPVHLWWLSKSSLLALAKQAGMTVEFFNFSEYNKMNRIFSVSHLKQLKPQEATLDCHGEPLISYPSRKEQMRRIFKKLGAKKIRNSFREVRARFTPRSACPNACNPTLVAILSHA